MNEIETMSNYLPVFNILGNTDLKARHMKKIYEILQLNN